MKKTLKFTGIGCGGLILLFIIIGVIASLSGGSTNGISSPSSLPSIGKTTVTADHYKQIQNGMSYRSVVSIIGIEGEEMSQNRIEAIPGVMDAVVTIMYQWTNSNGSGMNAMFQNDKLMQKAQFGLR